MKLAFVSTWGQHCGISTYTEELVEALRETPDVRIMIAAPSELGVAIREEASLAPHQSLWQRREMVFERLVQGLAGFDVVHFQHEFGLFQINQTFLAACQALREAGSKVVVTLHTVHPFGGPVGGGFHAALAGTVDLLIVHTVEAAASLYMDTRGRGAAIEVVPHGARLAARDGDRERGARLLGLPRTLAHHVVVGDIPVCLVYGFQGPNKNTHMTLRTFALACSLRLAGNALLVIAGEASDDRYMLSLGSEIDASGHLNRLFLAPGFTPVEDVPHVLAAADFSVLNSNSWVFSSSGAAHALAAHKVPCAVVNRPIYREAIGGGALPFELHEGSCDTPSQSLVTALGALAVGPRLRAAIAEAQRAWVEAVAWPKIAERHMQLYRKVLA